MYCAEGMNTDPAKVDPSIYISALSNKDNLISFLCMMQSKADFINNFWTKNNTIATINTIESTLLMDTKTPKMFWTNTAGF